MRREGCAREEVRLPSHPSTIYRGNGRGGGALGFPLRGAAARADGISPLGDLAPKPGGGNPRWGAPNPLATWE